MARKMTKSGTGYSSFFPLISYRHFVRNNRVLTYILAAILVVWPLLAYAEHVRSSTHEQLEKIASDYDSNLVLSARAYREVRQEGVDRVQRLRVSTEIADFWRVLYSPDEDFSDIVKLYKKNVVTWESVLQKSTLQNSDEVIWIDLLGLQAAAFNEFISKTCHTNLVLDKGAGKSPISVIGTEKLRIGRLCGDYILFLSASGITIKRIQDRVSGVIED
jgi:hypothetical protein